MTYPISFIPLIFECTVTTLRKCPFTASDITENILKEEEDLKVDFKQRCCTYFHGTRVSTTAD
jgi:hypothetical protein